MVSGGDAFGRYELRGTLGRGGFAIVHRAWDPALGREVALKALLPQLAIDPSIRQRFLAEARALAQLHHASIVTVYDVGEADGRPFFAMELIEGQTVARIATPGQGLPLDRILPILRRVADALDYLHDHKLVHRDIKAANIMVEPSGRVVLMDLGIARALDQEQVTLSGISLGTPEAMAPEQVQGRPVGPAADIYALGILTYKLLAGRAPFVGDTAHVMHAHAYELPPPLRTVRPGLPEAVYSAVAAALAKDPVQRPSSATAFVEALVAEASIEDTIRDTLVVAPTQSFTREMDSAPARAWSGPVAGRVDHRDQRRRLAIAAGVVVALLAVGSAVAIAVGRGGSGSRGTAALATIQAVAGLGIAGNGSTPAPTPVDSALPPVATPPVTASASQTVVAAASSAGATSVVTTTRPAPSPVRSPSLTELPAAVSAIGVNADDPSCCVVRVERAQGLGGGSIRLDLSFTVHGGIGWSGDSNPAYFSDIYLLDEQGRRFPLLEVTGPSASDDPRATAISGSYRFGPLPTDERFVWLYYGTDKSHTRTVVLGFDLGTAAPAPAPAPREQQVTAGGTDATCCHVAVMRAQGFPNGSIRLLLSFALIAPRSWRGDNRPEKAATIYLVDEQGKRYGLSRAIGPSGSDDPKAVATSGWYAFPTLSSGTQRVHLQYGDASMDFNLGAAAPPNR